MVKLWWIRLYICKFKQSVILNIKQEDSSVHSPSLTLAFPITIYAPCPHSWNQSENNSRNNEISMSWVDKKIFWGFLVNKCHWIDIKIDKKIQVSKNSILLKSSLVQTDFGNPKSYNSSSVSWTILTDLGMYLFERIQT